MADPSTISGLVAWFRADSITGTADGSAPQFWPDKTGNAQMAWISAPPTAAVWKASVLNGQPSLRFNGTANQGFVSSNKPPTGSQTIIVVTANQSSSTSAGTMTSANADGALQFRLASGRPNFVAQRQLELGTGTIVAPAAGAVVTGSYDTAAGSAWWVNGTAAGTSTTTRALTTEYSTIGLNPKSGSEVFAGDILEVMRWNRVLTAGERASVHSYVQDRYAITVADYAGISSAAYAGGGTLAAAGRPTAVGSAGYGSSGTLTSTGTPAVRQPLSYAGGGALSTDGAPQASSTASYSATGTIVTTGTTSAGSSAAYAADGCLTATATPSLNRPVAYVGNGQLITASSTDMRSAAVYASTGTLTALGNAVMNSLRWGPTQVRAAYRGATRIRHVAYGGHLIRV